MVIGFMEKLSWFADILSLSDFDLVLFGIFKGLWFVYHGEEIGKGFLAQSFLRVDRAWSSLRI